MTAPAKKTRGRPALPPEQRQTERAEVRMTKAQREKLDKLGGAAWLRDRIDKAKAAPDWQTPVVHDHGEEPA